MNTEILTKRIKRLLLLFVIALVVSSLTAFPLEWELQQLRSFLIDNNLQNSSIGQWVERVYEGILSTNHKYPFMAYGTDWLAFAHLVIAVAFIGPLKDPVRNIWVMQFGLIACLGIFPLSLIAGEIREIPIFWRLIDCSFSIIGFIPLFFCIKWTKRLEGMSYKVSPTSTLEELKIYDF